MPRKDRTAKTESSDRKPKPRKLTQLDRIEDLQRDISERLGRIEKKLDELLPRPYIMQGWDYDKPGWDRNIPPYPVDPMPAYPTPVQPAPRYWGPPMTWPDRPIVWGDGPTCGDKTGGRLNDIPYGDYDPRRNPHYATPSQSQTYERQQN